MSTSLRIEELKKKFDENPRRYFAPLANEYRKAGDLQQAIAICQAHLPQQPGHMSGHIVYGQALFEARQFEQARTVFETALALDPENLIALRYLGDIAFELGDRSGARTWYTRVLETDPRNEEIAALMAAMGEDRSTPSPAAPATTTAPPAEAAAPPLEPARAEPVAEAAAPGSKETAVPPEPAKPRETAALSAADAELERLFARPGEQPTAASTGGPGAAPPPPSSFSPLSGFASPARSDAPSSLEQRAPSLATPSTGPAEPPAPALPESAPPRPTFAAPRGDDTPLQDPPAERSASQTMPPAQAGATADAGFVTETMAELYVKQGFYDRAVDVYRQLVARSPGDRGLRDRMERVERELRSAGSGGPTSTSAGARGGAAPSRTGPTVRQFLAGIGSRGLTGRGPGVAPPPGGGPRTSGEFRIPAERPARAASAGSIDALFAGASPSREDVAAASTLADAFPGGSGGAAPDSHIGGRPAHPAATELSLDHVFRDGGTVGAGRSASAVSYDQFFSQPGQASGEATEDTPAGAPPAGGSDDIEQFNAWLQGLKKR